MARCHNGVRRYDGRFRGWRLASLFLTSSVFIPIGASACPTQFSEDGLWITSEPGWSDDVIYVIANLTVSNDEAADIVFAPSASDTIQVWIPPQEAANPYEVPVYDLSGLATYKVSPAGNTYGPGDSVSWQVAFDVSGASETYQSVLSVRPEESDQFGQFSFSIVASELACSSGEPFFIEILDFEAASEEILLTVSAEAGLSAITSYAATCSDDGGMEYSASSTDTRITISGLVDDVDYTCTANATNASGTSTNSAVTDAITPTLDAGLPIWLLNEAIP